MTALSALIDALIVGDAVTTGGLAMIPLIRRMTDARQYRTLDEALHGGDVAVTEVSEAGSVPELRFHNGTELPVLLIDGETLIGAKQNRTLNVSIYAPSKQDITIPVSCVEAGRWARGSWSFSASRDHMFASGRARIMGDVHDAMDAGFEPRAQQGQVWADIDRKMKRMGVQSATQAMDEMFTALDSKISDLASQLRAQANQVGAIFSLHGRVVGMDCFDCDDTFAVLLPKILRSYGLDALDDSAELLGSDIKTAEEFLLLVSQADQIDGPSPGVGTHVRLEGRNVIGSALVVDGRVVHMCAFWSDASDARSGDNGPMIVP